MVSISVAKDLLRNEVIKRSPEKKIAKTFSEKTTFTKTQQLNCKKNTIKRLCFKNKYIYIIFIFRMNRYTLLFYSELI